ncbi:MAG: ABC transporter substrate-binding protein [Propionibacteriaceae bacterium]|jgi:peptide/nickel transport system substrate-binding protein|uniref:Solute-binding protein family 5 domain n=1 Tax=Propionibacterium ruminifibrarum TaxID=1962131 RepID=A0A375HY82_9ACTN|nr:ABC transporter substrate-binding protein [Propionibacterium ruminifibrarum]MBE6478770.1 ABC transporter substrate-binding protein [Propionibacteriaceae bacterium]SPF67228.1 Solute-binding protein family 5 domain [Propionibacterium ruminifibrarum]
MNIRLGRRSFLGATVIGAAASLVACSSGGAETQEQARQLVIGATAPPAALDPSTNSGAAIPQALLYNVYETLVKIDSDGQIVPLLATSWNESEDGLTYTFTLQPKATFASGAALDAEAVKTSLERVKNDDAVLATLKSQLGAMESVTVQDASTVVVKLSQRDNDWLYYAAQTAGIIYDPDGIDSLGTAPAGSGPFVFESWSEGNPMVLTRNESYWGTPTVFDSVTFKYFSDPTAENSAMSSGDLDVISNMQAPQAISQFEDPDQYTILNGTSMGEVVLGFNHQREAFSDVRVRQAINYAINRSDLLQTVTAGYGTLIGSMVAPTDPWYEDLADTYGYDPDTARRLLAEAGYGEGLDLSLRVPSLPYATSAATFITSQLAQVGITVTTDTLEFPSRWIDEVMTKSNYDMTIISHVEGRDIAKWANPEYYWHYDNPEFTQLITEAKTGPADEQTEKMKQAARVLADDAAADFLYSMANLVVLRAGISGISENLTSESMDLTAASSTDI